jgi:putative N6-adenine-specific DNA methylase
MYDYQLKQEYFALIADDVLDIGCEELAKLGAENVRAAYRGVYFNAVRSVLYRVNYESRLITRVIAPLSIFSCRNADHLYRKGSDIEWRDFFSADHSFAVFASVSNSTAVSHSEFAALRLKDAIVDYFRNLSGSRPMVEKINPDIWINLHIENNQAVIGIDTSGGSLHRRGYRKQTVKAPIQETLAAAIMRISAWNGQRPLYDPMCGSGTLVAEALMHYCRIPAGFLRKRFGFEFLPDYDRKTWKQVKAAADRQIRKLPQGLIAASDISEKAVAATLANLRELPHGDRIAVVVKDFQQISRLENRLIVCNPPYGIRLDTPAELEMWYKQFGDFLKQRCLNSLAYVYAGNRDLIPHIGLKPSMKLPLKNGGLDGRLLKFEIY